MLLISVCGNAQWLQMSNGLGNGHNAYTFITDNNAILVATDTGMYRSTNNGSNWYPVNNGFTGWVVNTLAAKGNNLFAGTFSCEMFLSTNFGSNWTNISQGFNGAGSVYSLYATNQYLFAGTNAHSIWRRPLSELVGINNINTNAPDNYSLSQNYPNPFNPSTVVRFQLSVVSDVSLKVYDIMGREVQTLVNERLNAGTYEVKFDARHGGSSSSLTSGVYFYKMVSEGFTETKRMLLIK